MVRLGTEARRDRKPPNGSRGGGARAGKREFGEHSFACVLGLVILEGRGSRFGFMVHGIKISTFQVRHGRCSRVAKTDVFSA